MTKVIEKFNGTPITELSWWELVKYNVALTQANAACGAYVTGSVKEAVYSQYGITFDVVKDGAK